jgi:hypothetical protein
MTRAKHAGFFVMALIVWGLAILAGQVVYEGLTTGCVKAKYGWHCQATAPILYLVTITLTGVACCCSIGIGDLFATFAVRHTR